MTDLSFMNRSNLELAEQLYNSYTQNPQSVDREWQIFFEGMEFAGSSNLSSSRAQGVSEKEVDVYRLIRAYRDYGHLKANLDPLGLNKRDHSFLNLENFGLSEKDFNQSFRASSFLDKENMTLKEILQKLETTYCGTLTAQLAECEPNVRLWFYKELENNGLILPQDQKQKIYEQLARTESLEKFIHTRFVGMKRFSIEGGDSLIPMLEHLVEKGTSLKVEEVVIGMAHRGRINVLANFMDKGLEDILSEFEGHMPHSDKYEGDVKYHLGYSSDKETQSGPCHLSLAFNPSHLEAVSPVVLGMTRAKQRVRKDTKERKKVVPVLIHGDAAFSGQGVVTETLQLSKLEGYQVGGTVHIISNNQIGFTTNPQDSRSTTYSSDTSKCIKAPVLLVNGDDVEACVRAMDIALRFRQEFAQDIVIDLICYRRYGHNEGDEPAFTQPKMYKKIKKHPTPMKIYSDELVKQGFSEEKLQSFYQQKIDNLQGILEEVRKNPPQQELDALGGLWTGLKHGTKEDLEKPVHTNVSGEKLLAMGEILSAEPADFKLNKKVQRLLAQRKKMIEDNAIDWGLGELLAYATLCSEGTPVRLSGQDCKRGTFTHRHAIYFDQETDREFSPLNTINYPEGEFCVYNSSLSELAVLGFEYGNASSDPTYLTIWEAQFGDFANGAQIMIDQFISSGETKWARMSGLTMLLPHGYEGQGPEHSSARLERYLQLCAQENMQVCNLTTPANLFHVLRRQVKRDFRKPLIIMSPKSLLRHPKVVSPLTDFTEGHFKEVIEDHTITQPENVETVILCSGKVFYDIEKAREEEKPNSQKVALVRLEQIYPLVHSQLAPQLNGYKNLKHIIWLQEEPKNMGAYSHVAPKIQEFLFELGIKKIPVQYVGRPEKASPATGSPKAHSDEQKAIIAECLKYM